VPRGDGYGPFPSLAALSASLGAQCRGAFAAYKTDGSVVVFAATSTDLYQAQQYDLWLVERVEGRRALFGAVGGDLWRSCSSIIW
jgi:hypothetical protein